MIDSTQILLTVVISVLTVLLTIIGLAVYQILREFKKSIEKIITKELPYKLSSQKFNEYLKELCQVCGIDEVTTGTKYNPKTQRKELGKYPKYELITSHSFRRSFATNYYKKIPTPILIEITGHSKESLFLEYIGKPKDKDENAKLFLSMVKEMNKEKESQLKAV